MAVFQWLNESNILHKSCIVEALTIKSRHVHIDCNYVKHDLYKVLYYLDTYYSHNIPVKVWAYHQAGKLPVFFV